MTVRLFVASAGTFIFAWLATTYFWAVPMESYQPEPSASGEIGKDQREVVATSAEESPHVVTTETTGMR
ncbi:MAG: hypothetical protein CMP28_09170 [Roseibacillus sp.]|nr:hypothetical protein [Roseibacillus sp.]